MGENVIMSGIITRITEIMYEMIETMSKLMTRMTEITKNNDWSG